jgi:hypothetical protein
MQVRNFCLPSVVQQVEARNWLGHVTRMNKRSVFVFKLDIPHNWMVDTQSFRAGKCSSQTDEQEGHFNSSHSPAPNETQAVQVGNI